MTGSQDFDADQVAECWSARAHIAENRAAQSLGLADDLKALVVERAVGRWRADAGRHELSFGASSGHLPAQAVGIYWASVASGKQKKPRSKVQSGGELSTTVVALKAVLQTGLPLKPDQVPDDLLKLAGVIARSVRVDDRLARVDALERLLKATFKAFAPKERREAVMGLFVVARGGRTLTERRRCAAGILDYELHHFRKRIEPQLLEEIAWQLHQDSLQYIRRTRDGEPFEASGHTPVITEEQVTHPDTAEHEVLLSRIWSDVYGLRAEVIAREATRDDPEQAAEHAEASIGALWYLARLLTRLNRYMERYGKGILHGTAEYNADSLIRLAGWTGELTTEQARELRFTLAQVGEWNREGFGEAIKRTVD